MEKLAATSAAASASLPTLTSLHFSPPLNVPQLIIELNRKYGVPKPRPSTAQEARPPVLPAMTPAEILAAWLKGGAAWLAAAERSVARSAAGAAQDLNVGPVLLIAPRFWEILQNLLRSRQRDAVINAALFLIKEAWPREEARRRATEAPAECPNWWTTLAADRTALARNLGRAAGEISWTEAIEQHGLPADSIPDDFLEMVASHLSLLSVEAGRTALRFLDRGQTLGAKAAITAPIRVWVQKMVKRGKEVPEGRLQIAALLRERIGDIVSPDAAARWHGLEPERKELRSWLVGEILRLLFSVLLPNGYGRHQTAERERFWTRYDHAVEKVWLLVCKAHKNRLQDPAFDRLQKLGILEIREFTGYAEQDGIWMLLRSRSGQLISIFEGNANTTLRIASFDIQPSVEHYVIDYEWIKYRSFKESNSKVWLKPHLSGWEYKVQEHLAMLDLHASPPHPR